MFSDQSLKALASLTECLVTPSCMNMGLLNYCECKSCSRHIFVNTPSPWLAKKIKWLVYGLLADPYTCKWKTKDKLCYFVFDRYLPQLSHFWECFCFRTPFKSGNCYIFDANSYLYRRPADWIIFLIGHSPPSPQDGPFEDDPPLLSLREAMLLQKPPPVLVQKSCCKENC